MLDKIAAILCVLSSNLRYLHWVLTSPHWWALHEQLGDMSDEAAKDADRVAEYALSFGGNVINPGKAAEYTGLKLYEDKKADALDAVMFTGSTIGVLLAHVRQASEESEQNPGVQNMLGDIYERWQVNMNYKLAGWVKGGV